MKIGFVGLGKMGGNMVERLLLGGHSCVVSNRSQAPIDVAVSKGAIGATDLADLVGKLEGQKVVWLMIPAGAPVDDSIAELKTLLKPGDVIVDGGNSNFRDSMRRGEELKAHGIHFMDAGTSGGVWGLQVGYCLMVGSSKEAFAVVEPALKTLAPENGYLRCGETGSGHFVKMVHNGIEYAIMQSYAEGFELMHRGPFPIDLPAVSKVWEHGSVVRSWLLELATLALEDDPNLEKVKPWVADSGEGRWTVHECVDYAVPAPTISAALFARFASRDEEGFGLRLLSALRNQFGGHAMKLEK
ncbi:MAG: decarboxylating 6-phosphogluconate dehydrogenase [Calditrichaeota bacterium]|nr:decarboxylating 6-phosphogluconate dehydrogenase [Calditrichota bacterium]MCB9369563.1 decarboxylating 6-phosphogluconate dehydrogenase [Calditrichota bacterium]